MDLRNLAVVIILFLLGPAIFVAGIFFQDVLNSGPSHQELVQELELQLQLLEELRELIAEAIEMITLLWLGGS